MEEEEEIMTSKTNPAKLGTEEGREKPQIFYKKRENL